MITIRPAGDRGYFDHGWLQTYHTFSFGHYHDPEHMGFRSLRVLNDDTVAPGRGFSEHAHANMEIVSYVLDGALEHKDSIGTGSVLHAGDVQCMTAGRGVRHSEFNHSETEPVRFIQIWLVPRAEGLQPGYAEQRFPDDVKEGKLCPIVSPDGRDGSLPIHQDAFVFASILERGQSVKHMFGRGRYGWIQVARGSVAVSGVELGRGDGAAVSGESELVLEGTTRGEFLLFDLS